MANTLEQDFLLAMMVMCEIEGGSVNRRAFSEEVESNLIFCGTRVDGGGKPGDLRRELNLGSRPKKEKKKYVKRTRVCVR